MQYMFALSRVECTAVVQRLVAFVLLGTLQNRNLNLSRLRFVVADRWVQLQDRFENLFQTNEDVRNRWLRTENWFNSTYWYRVRISQVTKETSFAARITFRLFQILRWSSLKKLLENNELVLWNLILWNILLWSLCLVKYSSLKPWSFQSSPR